MLSAVEETKKGERDAQTDHSPEIVRRLIQSAVARVRNIDMGRTVEQQPLRQSSGLLAAAAVAAVLAFAFGPDYLRHGLGALLTPMGSIEAASPYAIEVLPGDATVARGADQTVTARLLGFDSDDVNLFLRSDDDSPFDRLPLVPMDDSEMFEVFVVRSGGEHRLLRRGGRRAVGSFHARSHRVAVRRAARARVSLPGVHRS